MEIITVCSENNTKYVKILCNKLQSGCSVVAGGAFSYRCWNVSVFMFLGETRKGKDCSPILKQIVECNLLSFYQ